MLEFLLKGIIRDRRRSLLAIIVVTIGVFAVIMMDGIINGMLSNTIEMTANHQAGHLRVMTRPYYAEQDQQPNDLAILDAAALTKELRQAYPTIDWVPRIHFGGLLDIPDEMGETKAQGPVAGQAYDLLSPASLEATRIGLQKAITAGTPITRQGEVMISIDFADKFGVRPGDTVTFFGATMYGSMTFHNYRVAGVLRFGNTMLDKGAILLDIADARTLLDMDDATGEILGFLPQGHYEAREAATVKASFNAAHAADTDEYAPIMLSLADDPATSQMLSYSYSMALIMLVLLILALSIVLWNAGVLGGIRRYNEFGVRLAMGEEKGHIFRTLLTESLIIGLIGSVLGTLLGLLMSWFISVHGLDYSRMMENIAMLMDPVIRSRIVPRMYFIGFIPGVLSMLIGSALAGRAIYKRNTAVLFKELD